MREILKNFHNKQNKKYTISLNKFAESLLWNFLNELDIHHLCKIVISWKWEFKMSRFLVSKSPSPSILHLSFGRQGGGHFRPKCSHLAGIRKAFCFLIRFLSLILSVLLSNFQISTRLVKLQWSILMVLSLLKKTSFPLNRKFDNALGMK